MPNTCVVGLGSPHGDDRFGWFVADQIAPECQRRGIAAVAVRRAGSPVNLLDWLDGLQRLLLIDAYHGTSAHDPLLRLDWPAHELQHLCGSGTHDYTLWQTLELAARLGRLPACCRLWCAPGMQFIAESALSPALVALAPQVTDDVLNALTVEV